MGDLYITDDCLMLNEVNHYVLYSCITNSYHLIDKIEKSPLPIELLHHLSNKIDISCLKMSDLSYSERY